MDKKAKPTSEHVPPKSDARHDPQFQDERYPTPPVGVPFPSLPRPPPDRQYSHPTFGYNPPQHLPHYFTPQARPNYLGSPTPNQHTSPWLRTPAHDAAAAAQTPISWSHALPPAPPQRTGYAVPGYDADDPFRSSSGVMNQGIDERTTFDDIHITPPPTTVPPPLPPYGFHRPEQTTIHYPTSISQHVPAYGRPPMQYHRPHHTPFIPPLQTPHEPSHPPHLPSWGIGSPYAHRPPKTRSDDGGSSHSTVQIDNSPPAAVETLPIESSMPPPNDEQLEQPSPIAIIIPSNSRPASPTAKYSPTSQGDGDSGGDRTSPLSPIDEQASPTYPPQAPLSTIPENTEPLSPLIIPNPVPSSPEASLSGTSDKDRYSRVVDQHRLPYLPMPLPPQRHSSYSPVVPAGPESNEISDQESSVEPFYVPYPTYQYPLPWPPQPIMNGQPLYFKPDRPSRPGIFEYSTREIPKEIYNLFLLRLPSLYYIRVVRIFTEADLTLSELKKMVLATAAEEKSTTVDTPFVIESQKMPMPPAYDKLKQTWEGFIDSVMREWKTFNVISVLLLSAILTILQIESAANDPITRYTALASLICALVSLIYGCLYIARFGTMRKTYKAAEWAMEAQKSTWVLWNVWVMLAMPAAWLAWSMILYICCIMSFLWRTSTHSVDYTPLSNGGLLAVRVVISVLLGLGLVYGILIATTFRRYGWDMDKAWQRRINGWIYMRKQQNLGMGAYPTPYGPGYQAPPPPTGHAGYGHGGYYPEPPPQGDDSQKYPWPRRSPQLPTFDGFYGQLPPHLYPTFNPPYFTQDKEKADLPSRDSKFTDSPTSLSPRSSTAYLPDSNKQPAYDGRSPSTTTQPLPGNYVEGRYRYAPKKKRRKGTYASQATTETWISADRFYPSAPRRSSTGRSDSVLSTRDPQNRRRPTANTRGTTDSDNSGAGWGWGYSTNQERKETSSSRVTNESRTYMDPPPSPPPGPRSPKHFSTSQSKRTLDESQGTQARQSQELDGPSTRIHESPKSVNASTGSEDHDDGNSVVLPMDPSPSTWPIDDAGSRYGFLTVPPSVPPSISDSPPSGAFGDSGDDGEDRVFRSPFDAIWMGSPPGHDSGDEALRRTDLNASAMLSDPRVLYLDPSQVEDGINNSRVQGD